MTGLHTYQALFNPPLDGISYEASRPFIAWHKPQLENNIEEWLKTDPPHLELATMAFDELRSRKRHRRAARQFDEEGLEPIAWLERAQVAARGALPVCHNKRQRGCVYAILRWGYKRGSPYGVYVGVTSKSVECRFLQHRRGIRAGRGLKLYGIEPLHSLFCWANPVSGSSGDREVYETRLHKALGPVVPNVSGDITDSYSGSN